MTDARPLVGTTVLDLLEPDLGAITRVYAALGADVVRPSGDLAGGRSISGLRRSIDGLGKRTVASADLFALAERADLIVQGLPSPGRIDAARHVSRERRDTVVVMTVSPFGIGTSFEGWRATDAVLHALSGTLSRSGLDGRAPLLPPGELALRCAMAQASYVGMAGMYAARVTGRGDRLDVSLLDAAVQALDPGYGISGSATLGRAARHLPPGRPAPGVQYPVLRCADGDVRLCLLAPRQWRNMRRWMGEPAAFVGPEFDNTAYRQQSAELLAALAGFVAGHTRAELEREGTARGVPIAGVRTFAECLSSSHLAERAALIDVTLPDGPTVRVPGGAIVIDGTRMNATADGSPVVAPRAPPSPAPTADPARPLAGLKVLDLGVIVVGGEQSRLLADLGADVVKVESAAFPDGTRHSYLPTGLSVSFAAGHRNKRSIGIDLKGEGGKALFRRLVERADIVLSNFKPGTLAALGLDPAALAAINPRIVIVESSAYGPDGVWAGRMGYGPLVRATAGLSSLWRYPDDEASWSDTITIYPDHVSARYGVVASLALLLRRGATGRGGHAALSQLEVILDHFAGEIAAADLGLDDPAMPPDAPWGVFAAAGEDQWCAITVDGDACWAAFAGVVGRPDWSTADYATAAARRHRRDAIERTVADWMAGQDADDAMRRLQAAGVPAARMLRVAELPAFAYYRERGLFRVDLHPYMDEPIVAERFHARSRRLDEAPSRPAPVMGEQSAEVVRDWLGLDDDATDALFAAGTLEGVPPHVARLIGEGRGRSPE